MARSQRIFKTTMLVTVVIIVILVQLFQTVGTRLAKRADKRIKQ